MCVCVCVWVGGWVDGWVRACVCASIMGKKKRHHVILRLRTLCLFIMKLLITCFVLVRLEVYSWCNNHKESLQSGACFIVIVIVIIALAWVKKKSKGVGLRSFEVYEHS